MKNAELQDNTFLNTNYRKHCPVCKKHVREHSKEDYKNCMRLLSDEIKVLPKSTKLEEKECYLCVKGAPHHHDKLPTCYLCIKNGKTIQFSNVEKYKKHLKTEHFL